jgi:predicted DNA-binding mobile mystery protein A
VKRNKDVLKTQRRILDQRFTTIRGLSLIQKPKSGWIKAVREGLGMTGAQLASRMNIAPSNVTILEGRESQSKTTLESMERAAKALGCKFVYAILPDDTLEKMIQAQAEKAAEELVRNVHHHMKLEKQNVEEDVRKEQIRSLAAEIKEKMDKRLWSTKK